MSHDYYTADRFHGDPGLAYANRMADEMLGLTPPDEQGADPSDDETARPLRVVPGPETTGERTDSPGEGEDTGGPEPWRLDDERAAVIAPWAAKRLAAAVGKARKGEATGMTDAVRKRWDAAAPVFCLARYLGGIGHYPQAELTRDGVADGLVDAAVDGGKVTATREALRAAAVAGWDSGNDAPLLPLDPGSPDIPRRNGRPAMLLPPADKMTSSSDGGAESDGAKALVEFALGIWRFGCDDDGELYAVPRAGLPVAMPCGERSPLRRQLTKRMLDATGRTFRAETYSLAVDYLRAEAEDAEPRGTHIRVAPWRGGVVLDLGRRDGRVVEIGPGRWEVVDGRPDHPLFRRPGGFAALPEPVRGGTLDVLADLLGFDPDGVQFRAVTGWHLTMLTAPGEDCPILWWLGARGAGKTIRSRITSALLDPGPLARGGGRGGQMGRSTEDVVVAARARFVVHFDNITTLSQKQSDILCGLTTGMSAENRALHTNADAAVVMAQCPVAITAKTFPVGAGDDLLDRSIQLHLDRMDGDWRRAARIADEFHAAHPGLLGALLDLAAAVLSYRDLIADAVDLSRMATHGETLAAADMATGLTPGQNGGYLAAYRETVRVAMSKEGERDPLVGGLIDVAERNDGEWSGTASDLLAALRRPVDPSIEWPTNGQSLSARLVKMTDVLAAVRLTVRKTKSNGKRGLTLARAESEPVDLTDLDAEAQL